MKMLKIHRISSRLDLFVAVLVLLQMSYGVWEIHYQQYSFASIAIYATAILTLLAYMRGNKMAWGMLFMFCLYILHEAICLYHNWYYAMDDYPRWLAVLQFAVAPVCLRVLAARTKSHSINRHEFAKVLGAVAIAAGMIFIRGKYFPAFGGIEMSRPVKMWEYLVDYSGFALWRTLLLMWCCYAGISILVWTYRSKCSALFR